MTSETPQKETARFYTAARRFPRLVGRLPDGSRIWGGPYRITQLVAGAIVLCGAVATRNVWGIDFLIADFAIAAGIAWFAAWLVGRIPTSELSPLVMIGAAVHGFRAPSSGTVAGRPVVLKRPHVARAAARVDRTQVSDPELEAASLLADASPELETTSLLADASPEVETTASSLPTRRSRTGLERLLEQTSRPAGS